MQDIKVAIGQIECCPSDLEGNLIRIEEIIVRAVGENARFAFFPETVDLGWVNPEAHQLAEPLPGRVSDRIAELAARHGIWIGIGLCEKTAKGLCDSAVLIDSHGQIRLKHRKINILSELMHPPYNPGTLEEISVIDTEYGRIGMLICADTFREDIRSRLASLQPDWIYVPFGWAAPRDHWPEHGFHLIQTVQRTAYDTRAAVVGPNLVGQIEHGPWKGQTFEGLSVAADRRGLLLAQGEWNQEGLISVTLPGTARIVR